MTAAQYVKRRVRDGVAVVEFFHPAHNSLPGGILEQLAGAVERAGGDERARVVVLRGGGGGAFCAGASFDELTVVADAADATAGAAAGAQFFEGFARVINAMRACPKFIIARVHGKAVGGGVGLAAAADYALASREAAVKLSELSIGLGPFVVGPAVARKIGVSAFSQLAIDSDSFYDAEWAREKGLYARVLDSTAELDAAVQALAARLASCNPEAMRELKRAFWRGAEDWDELLAARAAVSGRLAAGDFTRRAVREFKRGRRPTGKAGKRR
ncbi:MAG: enoyl-CoA hydratase-related protein [Gammaproteobacteria bacterium]|nr:enoyl-CoA hydratase-related protein [Gammaproteobacteria bacterium]